MKKKTEYRIVEYLSKLENYERNEKEYKIQIKYSGLFSSWQNYGHSYTDYYNGVQTGGSYFRIETFSNLKEAKEALKNLKKRKGYKRIIK